jgi:hypothetical protein
MSKSTDIPEFNFDALADFQCGENRKEGALPHGRTPRSSCQDTTITTALLSCKVPKKWCR